MKVADDTFQGDAECLWVKGTSEILQKNTYRIACRKAYFQNKAYLFMFLVKGMI